VKPCRSSLKNPIENFTLPFLKNLARLIENNVELISALNIVERLFDKLEEKAIVCAIKCSIRDGKSLSKAIADFPKFFNELTIKVIEIAEQTAGLTESLKNIINYLSVSKDTIKRLKNAIMYPIILLGFAIFIVVFWLIVVIPKFAEMFIDTGIELPFFTHCVLNISSFCTNSPVTLVVMLGFVALLLIAVCRSKKYRRNLVKHIPVIRKIRREFVAMNFFYGTAIMLQEKVVLLEAIKSMATVDDDIYASRIDVFITNGNSLTNALRKCKVFKDYEISIIKTGEQSGDLQSAFKSVSDILKIKLQQKLERIIILIQPLTLITIGVLLILIIYSVILPMYSTIELGI
jgi:type IV pilus assembly protein PilC